MAVKTAQVWRQSKIAREMLCFTIETAVSEREDRSRTGECGLDSLSARYIRYRQVARTFSAF